MRDAVGGYERRPVHAELGLGPGRCGGEEPRVAGEREFGHGIGEATPDFARIGVFHRYPELRGFVVPAQQLHVDLVELLASTEDLEQQRLRVRGLVFHVEPREHHRHRVAVAAGSS